MQNRLVKHFQTSLGWLIPVILLFLLSLVYRVTFLHTPFWVDEFSTANQASLFLKYGLMAFRNSPQYVEYHNIIPHILVSLSMKVLGSTTTAVRLPFMIIGSVVPVAVFLLARRVSNSYTAILASLMSTTSYFFITWSRQARGYVLQQLLGLLTLWLYLRLTEERTTVWEKLAFIALIIAGLLTHTMFLFLLVAMGLHYLFFHRREVLQKFSLLTIGLLLGIVAIIVFSTGQASTMVTYLQDLAQKGIQSNVWYYHSFLWREYMLISFLGIIGIFAGLFTKTRAFALILLHSLVQLFFICFLMGPHVSRYLLPIFAYLFIGVAYLFTSISEMLRQKYDAMFLRRNFFIILPLLLTGILIINGDIFTPKPKAFYSVDHDFREIALIDYDVVYDLVKTKGKLEEGKTAVIDTWPDRLAWYLGNDYPHQYTFRWSDDPDMMKRTPYRYNSSHEKVLDLRPQSKLISDVNDLQLVLKKYPRGFIWIDDSTLPQDVREYVSAHFKKELELDHYALDDNPYSQWPGQLYSWGIQ